MIIVHHMSAKQIAELTDVFAQPIELDGDLIWVIPNWLIVLKEHCKH